MITEDRVTFEIAKLLEEKGFDEHCDYVYDGTTLKWLYGLFIFFGEPTDTNSKLKKCGNDEIITAPTIQMAMKWLREVQNLFVFPFPQMNTNKFWTEIYQLSDNQEWENLYCESIDLQDYPTYEEACEAAIKYILENLI